MLEVHHIFKKYEGRPLLEDISFRVETGETICLLGASGSGKSTLLRIVAGLEDPDSGSVSFDGQDLRSTPAHQRDFGLVFQDYALFPHLDVRDNVAFGLRMRRLPEPELSERVASSLELVNLSGFENRRVTDLSGGEQQRVALARALATRPRLLMFDEPLGALDQTLKEDLLAELRSILHHADVPAIYVTHDQEEAFAIADRLLILQDGRIIREGTPADVWEQPGSAFVARFLGLGRIVDGIIKRKVDGMWEVESEWGVLSLRCGHEHRAGERIQMLARPRRSSSEEGETLEMGRLDPVNRLDGVVSDVLFQQGQYKVTLDNGLFMYLPEPVQVGERVGVRVQVECLT